MLRSEINELENIVGAILADWDNHSEGARSDHVAAVHKACDALKAKWTQEFLSTAKEQVIKRYVQYHQAGLVRLADKISTLNTKDRSNWLDTINTDLENVLDFLQHQFHNFFDQDHPATLHHCQVIEGLHREIQSDSTNPVNVRLDPALISCVGESIKDILAEGRISGISYRQAEQCLNFARLVRRVLQTGGISTEDMIRMVFQQNLNSLHFSNWYKGHIESVLSTFKHRKEKDGYIDDQIRSLGSVYVNPDKALFPELPGIDSALLQWLNGQITHWATNADAKTPGMAFPLNLSVPQFALFVRVFYKTGCLSVDNVALITRFFTGHFTTKKQAHISPKSFGRAFYDLDQSAAAVVRDLLQKMLNYLNKTYFP